MEEIFGVILELYVLIDKFIYIEYLINNILFENIDELEVIILFLVFD